MRMVTIPNQLSVSKAFQEFNEDARMKPSTHYERVVGVTEELIKGPLLTRDRSPHLVDRYSECLGSAAELTGRVKSTRYVNVSPNATDLGEESLLSQPAVLETGPPQPYNDVGARAHQAPKKIGAMLLAHQHNRAEVDAEVIRRRPARRALAFRLA